MTIDGVISALASQTGYGVQLAQAAARSRPIAPVDPIQRRTPDEAPATDATEESSEPTSLFDVEDTVELSAAALNADASSEASAATSSNASERTAEEAPQDAPADAPKNASGEALSEDEQQEVDELDARDNEVRQHEQAHMAAAGGYARGGASYEYETGPDGKRYAVGGEVQIDTSEVADDPEATIAKMQVVRAAAMAPAEPSGQDHAVAASAAAKMQQARAELAQQQTEQASGESDESTEPAAAEYDASGRSTRASDSSDGEEPRSQAQTLTADEPAFVDAYA